jgi:uncharacterized protein YgiM (DUF1202 family)
MEVIMKNWIFGFMILVLAAGVPAFGEQMSIVVKETQAREKPSYLGKTVAMFKYGDKVEILLLEKDWYKVKLSGGKTGWLHASALTKADVKVGVGKADASKYADSKDVVLAGKGFNQQVEQQYKKDTKLDYSGIDRMEKIVVTQAQKEDFLRKGNLGGTEGGE